MKTISLKIIAEEATSEGLKELLEKYMCTFLVQSRLIPNSDGKGLHAFLTLTFPPKGRSSGFDVCRS